MRAFGWESRDSSLGKAACWYHDVQGKVGNIFFFHFEFLLTIYLFLFSRYFIKVFHYLPFFVKYKSRNQAEKLI